MPVRTAAPKWDVRGKGEPLLLIRPLGGSIRLWGAFRRELAHSFTVYSYDHESVLTTRKLAEGALAVLDRYALQSAYVFGLSLGGMTATMLAARHPKRVRKMVLGSTPERGVATASVKGIAALIEGFAPHREIIEAILSPQFREEQPDEVDRIRHATKRAPGTVAKLLVAAARHDARRIQVKVPTMIIAGRRDNLVSVKSQRALAKRWGATFKLIDSGHDLSLEAPLETAELVRKFCRA